MIKINGVTMPTPSTYLCTIQDISKAERNARGTMIIERVTTKRKLEMTWEYLSQSELSLLLQAVSPVNFNVEYIDSQTGTIATKTFYVGDRKTGALDYRGNVIRWTGTGFNFIEW